MSNTAPLFLLKTTEYFQRTPKRIQVEPGRDTSTAEILVPPPTPGDLIAPRYAICEMRRQANGDYRPIPVEWGEWVRISDNVLEKLGINLSRHTIRRLAGNGYIQTRQISPAVIEFNLVSLVEHLRAVADDEWFWTRKLEGGMSRSEAYDQKLHLRTR